MSPMFRALTLAAAILAGQSLSSAAFAAEHGWPTDEILGEEKAPVTIIEYASLGCPHCADFAEHTLPKLKADFIDTGKVRLLYRDFPLDARALAAAMIAHCSGIRYFNFVDTFYRSQGQWATAADPIAAIKDIARLGGFSAADADKCLKDQALLNEINARQEEAQKNYGIDSTPSFIINGKMHSGFMSYDEISAILRPLVK